MGQTESTSCNSRACKACSSSDPTTDTVKIDQSVLGMVDKENAAPNISQCKSVEETFEQKENRQLEAMRRAEEERLAHQERQRQHLEQQRMQEQQRRRAEAERAEQAKEVEQEELMERQRQQVSAAQREEAARRQQEALEEEARRKAAERMEQERKAKEESDKKAVEEFLSCNGFSDVNYKRSKMMKKSYPLHEAVQQNNAPLAQLLLAAKANPELKNSANQTALQLAQKNNRDNSHAAVLQALNPAE